MTREEALRALEELAASPAAKWIGNRPLDGGMKMLQKCTRCGAEQVLEMPETMVAAYHRGERGYALASHVPSDFDDKLYAWKRSFQVAHEACAEGAA